MSPQHGNSVPARSLALERTEMKSAIAALVVFSASVLPVKAQQPSTVGTLLVAHGGGPVWDARLDTVARQVNTGGPVAVSLLMGSGAATRRFQDAVAQLVKDGAQEIVIVPVFVSSHSGHIDQVRYLAGLRDSLDEQMMHHLHMAGITRPTIKVPMHVTAALDDAPQLARILADRARALSTTSREQALFLIGHGPNSSEDNASWMRNLRAVADTVRRLTGFRDVKVGLIRDDAPAAVRAEAIRGIRETIQLQHDVTQKSVVVVPILISSGSVATAKIPADLANLPITYNAVPLLPHAEMARWIEARVTQALGRVASK